MTTGDGEWGRHECYSEFAANLSEATPQDYATIPLENSLTKTDYRHAAHCMIYASWSRRIFDVYHPRASILMQIRFDGYLGFPGGKVDEHEDIVSALNRELKEEIDLDLEKHKVKLEDHVVTHVNDKLNLVTHFFFLHVTYQEFKEIERCALEAEHFGEEVLGITRVPLYTMADDYHGLPVFLTHRFIGNCREQLLKALEFRNILNEEELQKAVDNSQKYSSPSKASSSLTNSKSNAD